MSTILIIGANGQLGSEIKNLSSKYNAEFIFTDIDTLDIANKNDLSDFFKKHAIDYIVNCAAYTAVDKAESEPKLAELLNVLAVKNLVEIAQKYNSKLIHISTDYVFDGTSHIPYNEGDKTNPTSIYGQTKLQGELAIVNSDANAIIIRTSWLYSSFGGNFVKTILKYGIERDELNVVVDQIGTPTYAYDLAGAILQIANSSIKDASYFKKGIYHYSNEGACSWYDFAQEIISIKNVTCKINSTDTKNYPTPAKRPHYSILNKEKIKATFNITIPYWRESLKKCLHIINIDRQSAD